MWEGPWDGGADRKSLEERSACFLLLLLLLLLLLALVPRGYFLFLQEQIKDIIIFRLEN
jgi:hypothetical protein